MGRFRFDGPDAAALLDRMNTRRVANLSPGQIRYGLMTQEDGGILDDILVYYLQDHDGQPYHSMVVNGVNREKIKAWLRPHLEETRVPFADQTLETAMIAVQGPLAIDLVDPLTNLALADLPYYRGNTGLIDDVPATISRTGYTGEDGCEIIVPREFALRVWTRLLAAGQPQQVIAAGLGARDTLRLEAGMPLYGHELNESINPYQAGLGFAVQLKNRDFIGHAALTQIRSQPLPQVRVGLQLEDRRVPREEFPICADGVQVGRVTSGTFSPTLQRAIAMGYVPRQWSQIGQMLTIDIRGRQHPATVVELPFYKRPS
jgi:aminomethyltransferase